MSTTINSIKVYFKVHDRKLIIGSYLASEFEACKDMWKYPDFDSSNSSSFDADFDEIIMRCMPLCNAINRFPVKRVFLTLIGMLKTVKNVISVECKGWMDSNRRRSVIELVNRNGKFAGITGITPSSEFIEDSIIPSDVRKQIEYLDVRFISFDARKECAQLKNFIKDTSIREIGLSLHTTCFLRALIWFTYFPGLVINDCYIFDLPPYFCTDEGREMTSYLKEIKNVANYSFARLTCGNDDDEYSSSEMINGFCRDYADQIKTITIDAKLITKRNVERLCRLSFDTLIITGKFTSTKLANDKANKELFRMILQMASLRFVLFVTNKLHVSGEYSGGEYSGLYMLIREFLHPGIKVVFSYDFILKNTDLSGRIIRVYKEACPNKEEFNDYDLLASY